MPSSALLHSSHKINPPITTTTTTTTPPKSRKQTMFDSENHVYPSDHMSRVFDSYEIDNHASVQETEKTEESWLWGSRIIGSGRKLSIDLDDDDGGNRVSGVTSPPIWRTNPTASPKHGKNQYRSLSPSSRAQAIARGQKELMEMVSKMPESSYELSLKDLVEQPMAEKESSIINNNSNNRNKGESFREKGNSNNNNNNNDNNKQLMVMKRSGSLDNERFLLKMALPVSLGNSKKSHKRNMKKAVSDLGFHSHTSGGNFHSKVTPRPRTTAVSDGSGKSFDKDWWKKRDSPLFEHDHGGGADSSVHSGSVKSSSPNSSRGSNSSNDTRHGNGGCWSFLHTRRKKKAHK